MLGMIIVKRLIILDKWTILGYNKNKRSNNRSINVANTFESKAMTADQEPFDNQATQAERRRVLAEGRHPSHMPPTPTTYFERSQHQQADQAPSSLDIPRQPASSPWARDPCPDEPPIDGTSEGDRMGVALGGKGGSDAA